MISSLWTLCQTCPSVTGKVISDFIFYSICIITRETNEFALFISGQPKILVSIIDWREYNRKRLYWWGGGGDLLKPYRAAALLLTGLNSLFFAFVSRKNNDGINTGVQLLCHQVMYYVYLVVSQFRPAPTLRRAWPYHFFLFFFHFPTSFSHGRLLLFFLRGGGGVFGRFRRHFPPNSSSSKRRFIMRYRTSQGGWGGNRTKRPERFLWLDRIRCQVWLSKSFTEPSINFDVSLNPLNTWNCFSYATQVWLLFSLSTELYAAHLLLLLDMSTTHSRENEIGRIDDTDTHECVTLI